MSYLSSTSPVVDRSTLGRPLLPGPKRRSAGRAMAIAPMSEEAKKASRLSSPAKTGYARGRLRSELPQRMPRPLRPWSGYCLEIFPIAKEASIRTHVITALEEICRTHTSHFTPSLKVVEVSIPRKRLWLWRPAPSCPPQKSRDRRPDRTQRKIQEESEARRGYGALKLLRSPSRPRRAPMGTSTSLPTPSAGEIDEGQERHHRLSRRQHERDARSDYRRGQSSRRVVSVRDHHLSQDLVPVALVAVAEVVRRAAVL